LERQLRAFWAPEVLGLVFASKKGK